MRLALLAALFAALAMPAFAQETGAPPVAMTAAPAPAGPRVLIQTTMGDIVLELDPVHAPLTVANFLRYVKERHYEGTVIYRVVPDFVIQMGSWKADVTAKPVHDPIPLEAGVPNTRGAVAMARLDPNSATAEFFIDLVDNPALDRAASDTANTTGFAVFAHVVSGMDVVDKISAVPRGDHGPMSGAAPVDPITLTKVTLLPAAAP